MHELEGPFCNREILNAASALKGIRGVIQMV